MCGIIGYAGAAQAAPILLDGLSKLEYRGYDSSGLAVMGPTEIQVRKARGRLNVLETMTEHGQNIRGHMGIGHTRWATHGEPSDVNSHPHLSANERFAVVHNGIIENYQELRATLERHGFVFRSQTDTEVVSHMVEYYDTGDLLTTVLKVLHRLEGSYALGVLSLDEPDRFIAVKKDSPLIAAIRPDGAFVASDIPALLPYTRDMFLIDDGELVEVSPSGLKFFNSMGESITKDVFHVDWDISAAEKGGYEHFMMKEIMEQPKAISDTLLPRIVDGRFAFENIAFSAEDLKQLTAIDIVACGSAYHAGLVGQYMIEKLVRIPVHVELASEFRYRQPIIDRRHLVIFVTQSGETADTLAALREAKRLGAQTLAIVNVVGSSIAREADHVIYTWAGPEIAVASTKGYTSQVMVFCMLAGYMAQQMGMISESRKTELIESMKILPDQINALLGDIESAQQMAAQYFNAKDVYFIGRGIDYALCQEASLKLKEISYIHSEGFAAGELKHGTISLIEEGVLVIGLATQPHLRDKLISNLVEVKSRGATILGLCLEGDDRMKDIADFVIEVPVIDPLLAPILSIIPLHLFAYYVAVYNGRDVDKPRNLAKSVTVE